MRDTRVGTERTPARAVGGWMLRHPRTMGTTSVLTPTTVMVGYQMMLWAAGDRSSSGWSRGVLERG